MAGLLRGVRRLRAGRLPRRRPSCARLHARRRGRGAGPPARRAGGGERALQRLPAPPGLARGPRARPPGVLRRRAGRAGLGEPAQRQSRPTGSTPVSGWCPTRWTPACSAPRRPEPGKTPRGCWSSRPGADQGDGRGCFTPSPASPPGGSPSGAGRGGRRPRAGSLRTGGLRADSACPSGSSSTAAAPGPRWRRLMRAADLLVQASESETLSGVVLEAQASGLPVVAGDVGGIPEALGPGRGRAGGAPETWTPSPQVSRPRCSQSPSGSTAPPSRRRRPSASGRGGDEDRWRGLRRGR